MKFIVENHSFRMHVLDRDIRAGAGVKPGAGPAAEYTEADFVKVAKGLALAMQTMRQSLVNGQRTDEGGTYSVRDRDPDLRVFAVDGDDRHELSVEDVLGMASAPPAPAEPTPDQKRIAELEAMLAQLRPAPEAPAAEKPADKPKGADKAK